MWKIAYGTIKIHHLLDMFSYFFHHTVENISSDIFFVFNLDTINPILLKRFAKQYKIYHSPFYPLRPYSTNALITTIPSSPSPKLLVPCSTDTQDSSQRHDVSSTLLHMARAPVITHTFFHSSPCFNVSHHHPSLPRHDPCWSITFPPFIPLLSLLLSSSEPIHQYDHSYNHGHSSF